MENKKKIQFTFRLQTLKNCKIRNIKAKYDHKIILNIIFIEKRKKHLNCF